MKLGELAGILKTAHKIVDEEWKKMPEEKRKKICENILARAKKRKGFPRGPESGPPDRRNV